MILTRSTQWNINLYQESLMDNLQQLILHLTNTQQELLILNLQM